MACLKDLAAAVIHVHAAGEAWIEAPNRAHDVDTFELIPAVFLEDGSILYGIFIWTRCSIGIAGVGVPRRRRIRMIVGDLAFTDDHVMRKHAPNSLMKATADGVVGHGEIGPCPRPTGMQLFESLFGKVQSGGRGIRLEVGPGAIPLDRVAPFRDLPFELDLGLR